MPQVNRHGTAVLLFAAIATTCIAQEQGPTFRTDVRRVVLNATVMDSKGHLITDLPQAAFKVYENGVEQSIRLFRREDIPVSMSIVIDNSGSMRDKRTRVETAAINLVKASNPQDEVMIVNFNDEAYEDVPFTSNMKKLEEGVARIDSRGGTAMRDAISLSIDRMKEAGKKDKRVMLVITDGNDNLSTITLERLVQKCHDSGVLIYAIGLLSQEEKREAKKAKRALDALTSASGGVSYYPNEVTEVEKLAQQVAHEIRNQYVLAYSPVNQALDGTFRQVKVTVNGPNHPVVRTRSGYYASPEGSAPRTAEVVPPAGSKKRK
jgi:Ca-activated chloride channel homolog